MVYFQRLRAHVVFINRLANSGRDTATGRLAEERAPRQLLPQTLIFESRSGRCAPRRVDQRSTNRVLRLRRWGGPGDTAFLTAEEAKPRIPPGLPSPSKSGTMLTWRSRSA